MCSQEGAAEEQEQEEENKLAACVALLQRTYTDLKLKVKNDPETVPKTTKLLFYMLLRFRGNSSTSVGTGTLDTWRLNFMLSCF